MLLDCWDATIYSVKREDRYNKPVVHGMNWHRFLFTINVVGMRTRFEIQYVFLVDSIPQVAVPGCSGGAFSYAWCQQWLQ